MREAAVTTAKLILMAALDLDDGVGKDGGIPWRLPEDMKRFRSLTLGGMVVVGAKTAATLPTLDGRGLMVMHRSGPTLSTALTWASVRNEDCVFVCGGHDVWLEAIESGLPAMLYLTRVYKSYGCDVKFPMDELLKPSRLWRLLQRGPTQPGPPLSSLQVWTNIH
jgi:dihydrofolate reductase